MCCRRGTGTNPPTPSAIPCVATVDSLWAFLRLIVARLSKVSGRPAPNQVKLGNLVGIVSVGCGTMEGKADGISWAQRTFFPGIVCSRMPERTGGRSRKMNDRADTVLRFFGLREHPFAATADPAYFFATRVHKECLFRLWHSIDGRQGMAVVLGDHGTGKTTVLRKVLSAMRAEPDKYAAAVIGSPIPSWTSLAFLENLADRLGFECEDRSISSLMDALNRHLVANRDRATTLIIDDAQNLNKRGQLELLRLAQNLETSRHKLLNLVFFAQLEWGEILQAVPSFLQRVNLTYQLEPVSLEETRELIRFRLGQAGAGPGGPLFDDYAIRAIHAYGEGIPRSMVGLCRNALLLAAHLGRREVDQALVLQTIQKTTLPNREKEARLASALASRERGTAPMPEPSRRPLGPLPGTSSVRARANELLLRAARGAGRGLPLEENL